LNSTNFIYLASQSPRRQALLAQIGVEFRPISVSVDETPLTGEAPADYARRLALEKARQGWTALGATQRAPVLGADTVVVVEGVILGKPLDAGQAGEMLARLSGRTHEVLTAVALVDDEERSRLNRSRVTFRELSERERSAYAEHPEPLGKAGGYAVQGRAAAFISNLEGSYSGVMGLPLFETAALLSKTGIHVV
jgi:septum formation protein